MNPSAQLPHQDESDKGEHSPLVWQLVPLAAASGLGPHRDEWAALNQRLTGGHAMLDAGFVDALVRHFAVHGVLLARATRQGEVVALALLEPQARGLGIWRSFQPAQAQVGTYLLPADLDLGSLLNVLPGRALELDLLCNDPLIGDLRRLPAGHAEAMPHALTMNIALRGCFDDYWAQRSRKLIQNMRRYLRRLQTEAETAGGTGMRVAQGVAEVDAAVARYAALESAGWKGREGTALQLDQDQGRFYRGLMLDFAARGEALVYELWLGDALLASRLVLLRDGQAVMLKTAFSEDHERFAPGRILLMRVLEDMFARLPDGVVEFYTDAEADLLAWSTGQRWISHVSVYPNAAVSFGLGVLRRGLRAWSRRKGSGRLDQAAMTQRSRATVESCAHVRDLPEDALALLQRAEAAYVEHGADWYGLLIDNVFKQDTSVRLLVLRRQSKVLAVLPAVCNATAAVRQGHEAGALANYYTSLYAPALAEDLTADDLLPLVLALTRECGGASTYRFAPMDPTAPAFALLRDAMQLAGLKTSTYFAFGNWFLPVQSDWPDYLKARSGQLRSTIKRMTRRLAQDGGHLEVLRDEADTERGIAAYQQVYAASWKAPEPYVDFVPGLIRLCARRGWLRLGLAWVADRPVAAQIWIVSGTRANIYKLAHDQAYEALAPGTVLSALMFEQAIAQDRVTEIDYLIGDDAYKKSWMSHRRERVGLIAFDPHTLRGLLGLLRQSLGQAWRAWHHPAPETAKVDNPDA